eukprot:GHVL01043051.1.p1 GENE.GHVL01043051.1~~GHVL01043051.1.p1  ORF type:complete len:239 (+),score=33.47 GHVL01043051.1:39-719(+)
MEELKVPKTSLQKQSGQRVVVVLYKARLEIVKVRDSYQLLHADEHKGLLAKFKKQISEYRPDITHQCLMTLLDSPLNKSGHLLIYISTSDNILIEISPQLRIPRNYKRFAGVMVELLHKQKLRSADGSTVLMKVIANPITKHLAPGGRFYGLSVSGSLINLRNFVQENFTELKSPVTFLVGAVAHEDPALEAEWVEENISISSYGLTASVCCSKLCNEFENLWNIL